MWKFYWMWFSKTFVKPLLIVDLLSGAFAIILGGIVYFNPQWEDTVSLLLWLVPSAVFAASIVIGFFLAPYLIYKDALKEKGKSQKELSLKEQIDKLIKEGEELRRLAVSQGEPIPEANASHWHTKVYNLLDKNFDLEWLNAFNRKYGEGNPEQKFSGTGMTNHIELWRKLQAGIEWLQDFQNQIKDT